MTKIMAAVVAVAALAMAQKPKSKKEQDALIAIQGEKDPAAKMAKVDAFVTQFADTEFKTWAYTQGRIAAQNLNDSAKIIIYCDLAMEADPKAYDSMLAEAGELARSTRENDLDKDQKLTKADKLVHQALEIIPTAPKPNPAITDPQWEEYRKEFLSDAHNDLGMIASVKKKYDVAIEEFKQASTIAAQPDPVVLVRLAGAYTDNKQPDEALATLAKVSDPRLAPFVASEKKRAEAMKAAKK
jgi:tetratricopeptide (TPR) repeat protein